MLLNFLKHTKMEAAFWVASIFFSTQSLPPGGSEKIPPHLLLCCGRGRGLPGPWLPWRCPREFGRGKPLPYAQQPKKCDKVQGLHSSFFIHHYSLIITARRPMASKISQKVDSSIHCHPSRGSAVR